MPLSRVHDTAAMPFALGLHDEVTLRQRHTSDKDRVRDKSKEGGDNQDKDKETKRSDKNGSGEKENQDGTDAATEGGDKVARKDAGAAGHAANVADKPADAVTPSQAEPTDPEAPAPRADAASKADTEAHGKADKVHRASSEATPDKAAEQKEAGTGADKHKREDGAAGQQEKPAPREKAMVGDIIEVSQHNSAKPPTYTVRCFQCVVICLAAARGVVVVLYSTLSYSRRTIVTQCTSPMLSCTNRV